MNALGRIFAQMTALTSQEDTTAPVESCSYSKQMGEAVQVGLDSVITIVIVVVVVNLYIANLFSFLST